MKDGEKGKHKIIDFQKFSELLVVVKNVTYEDVVLYMYQPADPSSLGIIRFLFGLLMLADLPEERGGAIIDIRWGDPTDCHFPLFYVLEAPSYSFISLIYCAMWFGACGIMMGYNFQVSTVLFGVPYWYLLLLDKSFWNNHSYLFGIITILLMGSSANHYFSLDGYLDGSIRNKHVPYWNYFILKFQFFVLYFLAGLKKADMEWLEGYSVAYLGNHWVFSPFKLILSSDKIDFLVVHWLGFLLDLTIGFWMLLEFTRPVAMFFCACFHLMNSRLFSIGMFPYVCLATMPLFCEEKWPRKMKEFFTKTTSQDPTPSTTCLYFENKRSEYNGIKLPRNATWKHKLVVALLIGHCGLQIFLPYSHFITKGYNNWTNGLYGYSWDMMVHSWDTILVVVKVVDNNSGIENFVDPTAFTHNDRWNKHSDMLLQYAQCLKRNILADLEKDTLSTTSSRKSTAPYITSENISIYVDVWCSLNKRFQQRMFNPNYDLLQAEWSPFQSVEWLMPVLSEYSDFRTQMNAIVDEVYSWSNYSDVLFIADFPGLTLENYIDENFRNVTLTILEGEVAYEIEDDLELQSVGTKLKKGDSHPVEVGTFHRIHTISSKPSCYMYTFINGRKFEEEEEEPLDKRRAMYSPFPFLEDIEDRIASFAALWTHIYNSILYILFGKPYHLRSKADQ